MKKKVITSFRKHLRLASIKFVNHLNSHLFVTVTLALIFSCLSTPAKTNIVTDRAVPVEATATSETIYFPNGSFDAGEAYWFFSRERGLQTRATAEFCYSPPGAMRIYADNDKGIGARVDSTLIPVKGPGLVELHFKIRAFSGRHLGLWIKQYDEHRKLLPIENGGECGGSAEKWNTMIREVLLDEKTAFLQLWFLAYPREGEVIDMFFDDFELKRIPMITPPYPSQFKLKPTDTDKLTAADVVGPDGIVYPNWTQVGVQGGIPDVPVAVKLADRGANPGTDIADLLDKACQDVGQQGGGAVLIGEGTFFLGRPIEIKDNGVVIRGSGRDATKLIFNYKLGTPEIELGFAWPAEGANVGPDTQVLMHMYPQGLKNVTVFLDDKQVKSQVMDGSWDFTMTISGAELLKTGGAGKATLRAEALYMDGHTVSAERSFVLGTEAQAVKESPSFKAVLFFRGYGLMSKQYFLAADGKRGDTTLVFKDVGDLKVGQHIELHAPGTIRFQTRIQHLIGGDDWKRIGFFRIDAINGNRVKINQPLRIDFPADAGTYASRLKSLERCGIENLSMEHTNRLPVNSIMFDWNWNSWARNVKVIMSGSAGIKSYRSKWLEIRDCELDGAWNTDGGQAYGGFTSCADSLYENCIVRKYRHAPVVQYGAMGNVFRNSTYEGSDLQWHAGWSTENLFENCIVNSIKGSGSISGQGSYGYGAYATGSSDIAHGPNGPRNVVYNCDISAELNGVKLLGVNENWIFVHNRFIAGKGAGFDATRGCFDHIISNNVFIVKDRSAPMLKLNTPDCVGIYLIGNTLVGGNGKVVEGAAPLALNKDNKVLPAVTPRPPRPEVTVPSIYEWQQNRTFPDK